jgi:hypothetical protein
MINPHPTRSLILALPLAILSICVMHAQDSTGFRSGYPAMDRFALSINHGGFLNFGPMVHVEMGLTQHLRIDTHMRFLTLGVAYQLYHSFTDVIAPPAPGLGVVYCFGNHIHKPYISVMGEYGYNKNKSWQQDDAYLYETYHLAVVGIGGGYRFRLPNGLFFGFGGYVFAAWGKKSSVYSYQEEEDLHWSDFRMDRPRILLDLRTGFEF